MSFEKWETIKLGDALTLKRGYDLTQVDRKPGKIPVISSSGFSGFHNISMVKGPGVVTGRYGTLGELFYVEEDYWPHNTTLYVKDFKGNDPRFIFYFLKTLNFGEKNDKTSVPGLNRNDLHLIEISLPSLPTQRRIAAILTALDDKIELNRRMNETLEGIAQAVCGEWFGKYASGEEELPEGWRWGTISDLVKHSKESVNPSKSPEKEFNHYSLPAFDNNQTPEKAFGLEILSNKFQVRKYSVLVSKLNPRIPRIWATGNIEEESAICSTEFQVFLPKKSSYYSFVNLLFQRKEVQEAMTTRASGTSGSHQRVNPSDILNIEVLIPIDAEIERFDHLVRDFIERKFLNNRQSRTLTALREALLPRLMRGEVKV